MRPLTRLARLTAPLLTLALITALAGCKSFGGEAEFTATLTVADCDGDARTFNEFDVDTFFGQPLKDPELGGQTIGTDIRRLNLRLQSGTEDFYLTDALSIQILDVKRVSEQSGDVQLGPNQLVRAQIELFNSCPRSETLGTATGTIRFEKTLSDDYGDEIAAEIHIDISDARGLGGMSGRLDGRFAFTLERGQPAQFFP